MHAAFLASATPKQHMTYSCKELEQIAEGQEARVDAAMRIMQRPDFNFPMKTLDDLFTITCGQCAIATPAIQWRERPILGKLPPDEYQCPACGEAFKRQSTEDRFKPVKLTPISTRL